MNFPGFLKLKGKCPSYLVELSKINGLPRTILSDRVVIITDIPHVKNFFPTYSFRGDSHPQEKVHVPVIRTVVRDAITEDLILIIDRDVPMFHECSFSTSPSRQFKYRDTSVVSFFKQGCPPIVLNIGVIGTTGFWASMVRSIRLFSDHYFERDLWEKSYIDSNLKFDEEYVCEDFTLDSIKMHDCLVSTQQSKVAAVLSGFYLHTDLRQKLEQGVADYR